MKLFLIFCSALLLLALAPLPIGYYTVLRIVVSIGCATVIFTEFSEGMNTWLVLFGITLIVFNPIIPVYLDDRDFWAPIDIAAAILFLVKAFSIPPSKKK